jgi:hypothetical protein
MQCSFGCHWAGSTSIDVSLKCDIMNVARSRCVHASVGLRAVAVRGHRHHRAAWCAFPCADCLAPVSSSVQTGWLDEAAQYTP